MSGDPSKVIRFPRRRGTPRPKPMCGQCGREMSGTFPRESDHLDHELQAGVTLNLRVFAECNEIEDSGPFRLRIASDAIYIERVGDRTGFYYDWGDLHAILSKWDEIAAESSKRPAIEVHDGGRPETPAP